MLFRPALQARMEKIPAAAIAKPTINGMSAENFVGNRMQKRPTARIRTRTRSEAMSTRRLRIDISAPQKSKQSFLFDNVRLYDNIAALFRR